MSVINFISSSVHTNQWGRSKDRRDNLKSKLYGVPNQIGTRAFGDTPVHWNSDHVQAVCSKLLDLGT